MHYYLYIIRSERDQKFYTGITDDLERRLDQHNKGNKGTPSTLSRGPFKLVYKEVFDNRKQAREREKFFKSGTGRELRNQLIS